MELDYYAYRRAQISQAMSEFEHAAAEFYQVKRQKDKDMRQQAERRLRQAANMAAKVEPHLVYLLYRASAPELGNFIRDAWQKGLAAGTTPEPFRAVPDGMAIALMPPLSFLVNAPFRLQKPYLSKDECDLCILDNPVRKEKVFQVPMVAATGWKGALRAALWQLGYGEDHEVVLRLFGNQRGSEEGQAGRLHLYPTFYDKIGLAVINPHSRKTGVGVSGPILMECVPQGAKGELALLYVPFGPMGQSESARRDEVARDLEVLTEGVLAMLTVYGFGAKTSSGFGTAEDRLDGRGTLALRAELPGLATSAKAASGPEQPTPNLPRYLESPTRLHTDFRRPDGGLKSEAEYQSHIKGRGGQYSKKDKQLYEKAQRWWEREGLRLSEDTPQEETPATSPTPEPPVQELTFTSLEELPALAQNVATHLRCGGGA